MHLRTGPCPQPGSDLRSRCSRTSSLKHSSGGRRPAALVRCRVAPHQQWVDAAAPPSSHSTAADRAQAAKRAQLQQQLERQCGQVPHAPYVPAPDAEGRAKQLTVEISQKQHWSQLHNKWLDNAAEFSPVHLTATLCRLARLACRDGVAAADRPELFKFSGALLSAVQDSVAQLDSRGVAQCLWAYAKLQSAAPHSSSSGDAAAATLAAALLHQGRLLQLQPSQLSQAAWAAATLQGMGMAMPAGWWAGVEQRALALMRYLKPCEAACCAWACTSNGRRLQPVLAEALQAHLVQMSGVYKARELLQVMLALAAAQQPRTTEQQQPSQQQPQKQEAHADAQSSSSSRGQPSFWLAVCYCRLEQEAPCMSATEVSTALLALSRLGARNRAHASSSSSSNSGQGQHHHQLPLQLGMRLLRRAHDTLPSSTPRDLVALAYALAKLELNPGAWWWARVLPFSAAALHVCTPSMLAVLAWSLAKLDVQPGAGWTQELLQHTGFKVHGLGAQEATMLMVALGKWRACPDLWWWAAFEDATQHLMPYFTAAELAGLLSGMGSTGPPPKQQQLPHPAMAPGALWRAATPYQQQHEKESEAPDYYPGGAWTAAMLVSAQRALSGAPAGSLGGILMGLAKLGIHPSTAWMDVFEAAVLSALPAASLKEVAAVLWGLSVMGVQPSTTLVQAADSRIMSVLQQGPSRRRAAGAAGVPGAAAAAAAAAAAEAAPAATASSSAAALDAGGSGLEPGQDGAHAPNPAAAHAAVGMDAEAAPAVVCVTGDASPPAPLQQWSGLLGAAGQATAPAPCSWPTGAVAAQLLWSVAWLPQPEGIAAWADDLLTAVMVPGLQHASQETLFVLLRSLAKLQHAPGCRQWVDAWWQAYATHIQPAEQAPAPLRFAEAAGGNDWHGSAQAESQHQQQLVPAGAQLDGLQHCPAAEQACLQLTVVMWCFSRLHVQPSHMTGWLQTVAGVTQPLLHQLSSKRFSLLLLAMARLHVWPGEAWLVEAEAVLLLHARRMPTKQTECAAASLSSMGWPVLL